MIGINCGTVIAGVIGILCPRYRLFGDAVNVASRMESTCEKGKIQITETFKERIDENIFITEALGERKIKGKGLMHTYFLNARRDHTSSLSSEGVTCPDIILTSFNDMYTDTSKFMNDFHPEIEI